MQLVVHVRGLGQDAGVLRCELNRFADQDKVAARIARAVRNWIRVVPVRHSGSRLDLTVTAEWIEPAKANTHTNHDVDAAAPRPKRKRKVRK